MQGGKPNKVAVYACPRHDGGVSIVRVLNDNNIAVVMAQRADQEKFTGEYIPCSEDDVPKDRMLRNAWCVGSGQKIEVDVRRGKEVVKDKMRIARKPKLEALDVETMRAAGIGNSNKLAEVEDKKQTLRDCTDCKRLADATTETELLEAWPTELLGEMPREVKRGS